MVTLQGFSFEEIAKRPFSSGNYTPDPVSIVTFVAAQSRDMKIAVPQAHPKERETWALGKAIYFYRAGPWDFACATCHAEDGKRIRTQNLPNFTKHDQAPRSFIGWPGYRMTGGVMHSLQWRLNDCFRQQRLPEPGYASDTVTALLTYMGVNSNGFVYKGPGIKR
jgi:sulfur-oxidizing protein SoxA